MEKKLELFKGVSSLRWKPLIKSEGAADFSRRLSLIEVAVAAASTYEHGRASLPRPLRASI